MADYCCPNLTQDSNVETTMYDGSFCRCFIAHSRGGGSRRRRRPRAPSAVRSPAASASRVPTPTVPLNRGPAAPPCCRQLAPRTIAALAPLLPVPAHLLPRPFVQLGPFATRTMTARPRQESPSVQDPVSLGRPVVRFKGAVTPAVAGRP